MLNKPLWGCKSCRGSSYYTYLFVYCCSIRVSRGKFLMNCWDIEFHHRSHILCWCWWHCMSGRKLGRNCILHSLQNVVASWSDSYRRSLPLEGRILMISIGWNCKWLIAWASIAMSASSARFGSYWFEDWYRFSSMLKEWCFGLVYTQALRYHGKFLESRNRHWTVRGKVWYFWS